MKTVKLVEDFYPIATVRYPEGKVRMNVIFDRHLRDYTPINQQDNLREFLDQTLDILDVERGFIPAASVERWLNSQQVVE